MSQEPTQSEVSLSSVSVRPLRQEEKDRFTSLLRAHHYLGFRGVVGESIWHVAEWQGEWVALLVWAAAAFKCSARDAWIGWHPAIAFQRLHWVANNLRFLILPGIRVANLASRVLGLSTRRLPEDWERAWGHSILLVETFVDPERFRGTCYRAAGWQLLGQTRGFSRQSGGWRHHGRPKQVLCRELIRGSRGILRNPTPSKLLNQGVAKMRLRYHEIDSLLDVLERLPDPRKKRGIRHSKTSILAISVAAVLAGMRSFEAIAQWARGCTQEELERFACRYNPKKAQREAPSEPTIRRVLQAIDAQQVDQQIGSWLEALCAGHDDAVAFDGKTVCGARRPDGTQVHLLSAVLHGSGVTIAQVEVDAKSNEIPAAPRLLAPLDLTGRCVTADALHTQKELAGFLVDEKGADYCFTVKENQPTLKEDLATLWEAESFPPSEHHAREATRSPRRAPHLGLDKAQ